MSASDAIVYDKTNVFYKILQGELPSFKIFETDTCIAILDAFPSTPGHSLLIPKAEYVTMEDMPAETAGAFLAELPRLIKIVKEATGADGVNVVQNNGQASGQVS